MLSNAWKVHRRIIGNGLKTYQLDRGVVIDYPINSEVGRRLYTHEFENDEITFIKNSLKSGDVLLDIGANAGIFSVIAARIVGPKGHVHAFEIGPAEVSLLKRNIAKNSLTNVSVHEYAVSNQTGEAKFALSVDGAMNSLAQNDHPLQTIREWIDVKTIRLDDALSRFSITRVDVIKMDVEGAEKLVFEGGLQALRRWKPRVILFESADMMSTGFGYTTADFIAFLQREGFQVYALGKDGLESYDAGLLATHYNFVAVP